MQKVIAALAGFLIGVAISWGSMYTQMQAALQRIAQGESTREEAVKGAKTLEGQLKEAQQAAEKLEADGKAAEAALKDAKNQLSSAVSAQEAAEKAADALKGRLAEAVSAKEEAEKALAEAKKPAPAPAAQ
jgi:biopolymer transport protein ExbB/TolQ